MHRVARLGRRRSGRDIRAGARQDGADHVPSVNIIVHDQHAHVIEPLRRGLDLLRTGQAHSLHRSNGVHDWQRDHERGALTRAGALGADRAAVQLGQVLDDRQAQAQAAVRPGGRAVALTEPIECMGHEFGAHPDSRVRNG